MGQIRFLFWILWGYSYFFGDEVKYIHSLLVMSMSECFSTKLKSKVSCSIELSSQRVFNIFFLGCSKHAILKNLYIYILKMSCLVFQKVRVFIYEALTSGCSSMKHWHRYDTGHHISWQTRIRYDGDKEIN